MISLWFDYAWVSTWSIFVACIGVGSCMNGIDEIIETNLGSLEQMKTSEYVWMFALGVCVLVILLLAIASQIYRWPA